MVTALGEMRRHVCLEGTDPKLYVSLRIANVPPISSNAGAWPCLSAAKAPKAGIPASRRAGGWQLERKVKLTEETIGQRDLAHRPAFAALQRFYAISATILSVIL